MTSVLFAYVRITARWCPINRSVSSVLMDHICARPSEFFVSWFDLSPAEIPSFHPLCVIWLRLVKIVVAQIFLGARILHFKMWGEKELILIPKGHVDFLQLDNRQSIFLTSNGSRIPKKWQKKCSGLLNNFYKFVFWIFIIYFP